MKSIALVAGGTGGHINAALALGAYFKERGHQVHYICGTRSLDLKLFHDRGAFQLNVLGLRYKNPFKVIKSIWMNFISFFKVIKFIRKNNIDYMIGTGGYVCGISLLAGYLSKKKIYILEQNSFMGMTNKLLSPFSEKIFLNFKDTKGLNEKYKPKCIVSGNPIRKMLVNEKINLGPEKDLRILVTGGSLGAKQVNDFVRELIKKLNEMRLSYYIIHQTGADKDILIDDENYLKLEYLENIANYYDWCNCVISRAGASTLSELEYIEKTSYLIPFPAATDNHQEVNAKSLKLSSKFPIDIYNKKISLEENITNCLALLNNRNNGNQVKAQGHAEKIIYDVVMGSRTT